MNKVVKTESEWRQELDPEQYRILREKGTEAPFSGEYDHVFEPGTYLCAGCGAEHQKKGGPAVAEPPIDPFEQFPALRTSVRSRTQRTPCSSPGTSGRRRRHPESAA